MPTVMREVICSYTSDELLAMPRDEIITGLTERERKFCEYYIGKNNVKVAAIKAGYSKPSAHIIGWRIRNLTRVNNYICWLKMRAAKSCHIEAMDLVDMYARIAFADITDIMTVKRNKIDIENSDSWDGQIVKKVTKGRDGSVTIELEDRRWALEKLERYFDVIPKDRKEQIETRKMELLEQRLALDKKKAGEDEEYEDDGFLEAIQDSVEEVWADDTEV